METQLLRGSSVNQVVKFYWSFYCKLFVCCFSLDHAGHTLSMSYKYTALRAESEEKHACPGNCIAGCRPILIPARPIQIQLPTCTCNSRATTPIFAQPGALRNTGVTRKKVSPRKRRCLHIKGFSFFSNLHPSLSFAGHGHVELHHNTPGFRCLLGCLSQDFRSEPSFKYLGTSLGGVVPIHGK
ncbi:unnamed protein product [Tuber melanosporum]|uniref:(Perigord truffle) hypothetical protein n=1 Tax=Tuber melanosporum (strain Mel28) TaxID=656061 RepID=D5G891_TUBMM|nr:uncharacterized protein GSTUM_00002934001 [Tuber melanosporum]CAZ80734.1 unnamed protein product [Tuber melanosporum]